MEDFSIFSRDTEIVTEELNKKKWLPFVSKGKVLRLLMSMSNRWVELYRARRYEDNKDVLTRMQELDRRYYERDEFRMQLLTEKLESFKKSFIRQSQCSFCMSVCKETAAARNNGLNCSCGRRVRYIKKLEEDLSAFMEQEVNRLIKEYQEGPKWEEKQESK